MTLPGKTLAALYCTLCLLAVVAGPLYLIARP